MIKIEELHIGQKVIYNYNSLVCFVYRISSPYPDKNERFNNKPTIDLWCGDGFITVLESEISEYPNERMKSNEEKSREISDNILGSLEYQCGAEEGAQEMAKWKDEQYRTAYVVTRSEEHSDYVETIFYDRDKAIEYCKPFNQNENSYGRDITILVDGEEKGIILSTDEIYKL